MPSWAPLRVPDPAASQTAGGRAVRRVAADLGFVEGPTLTAAGSLVVVSIDRSLIYELDTSGEVRVLAETEGAPNGATEGRDGALYVTHFWGAWPADLSRTSVGGVLVWHAGMLRWLTRDPIAPNDLCFGPDGLLYVTDPTRGVPDGRLWRCDVETGRATLLCSVDWTPNGIAFDADDRLWVADMTARRLVGYRVDRDGLSDPVDSIRMAHGKPDGFAFDRGGNLVVAAPGTDDDPQSTVQRYTGDGRLTDVLLAEPGGHYTNAAIAGDGTLYVTDAGRGSVLAVTGATDPGLPLHPFR